MWDDLFLPLSSRCRGRYPACFKTPSPSPLFATSWKISGKARLVTWLGLEEVIYLVHLFMSGFFCKYQPNRNLETHLEPRRCCTPLTGIPRPSTSDVVRSLCFETGKSIEVYILDDGIEISKRRRARLKVH